MRAAISIALALAFASPAASQRPIPPAPAQPGPAQRSNVRPTEVAVTVEGCIFGRQLRLTEGVPGTHELALNASEFVMEGSKELLRQLARDHDGHQEIITGIAIIPPQPG